MVHGRSPRPKETLTSLRAAYDAIAVEVGLARADDVEAVEAPGDRVAKGR
jgi:riboflavin biosynthesis pyrimidine reductase